MDNLKLIIYFRVQDNRQPEISDVPKTAFIANPRIEGIVAIGLSKHMRVCLVFV